MFGNHTANFWLTLRMLKCCRHAGRTRFDWVLTGNILMIARAVKILLRSFDRSLTKTIWQSLVSLHA